VNALYGERVKVQLAASSSWDGIQFGMARPGTPVRTYALPPRLRKDAPAEVWMHSTLFELGGTRLAARVAHLNAGGRPVDARWAMLYTFAVAQNASQQSLEIAVVGEWLVIALPKEALINAIAAPR
jgi:hypothetical protein